MHPKPLAIALTLVAVALPANAAAQSERDRTPPTVKVATDASARCDGERTRLRVRIVDDSATRAVVRVEGRVVKRSTRKRFVVSLRLGSGAHTIRTVARDKSNNRFMHVLRLTPCS